MMNNKIKKSLEIIEENIANHVKPIIWSSFGKDSLVLISLVHKVDTSVPILFQKEYICSEKYQHANKIILENNLCVYSYPPVNTSIQFTHNKDGSIEWEVQNYYSYANNKNYTIPTGIVDNPKSDICCLEKIYCKPFSFTHYLWDMQFIGHKDSDTDAFYNSLRLDDYTYKKQELPTCVFPLKDWKDIDIWEYIDKNNIDFNSKRYVRNGENWRGQFKDTTYNPDYFECCLECMKNTSPEKVFCHKENKFIPNISHLIRYDNAPQLEYFNKE